MVPTVRLDGLTLRSQMPIRKGRREHRKKVAAAKRIERRGTGESLFTVSFHSPETTTQLCLLTRFPGSSGPYCVFLGHELNELYATSSPSPAKGVSSSVRSANLQWHLRKGGHYHWLVEGPGRASFI